MAQSVPQDLAISPSATLLGSNFPQCCKMAAADPIWHHYTTMYKIFPSCLSLFTFYQGGRFFLKFCPHPPPGDLPFHLTCPNWGTHVPLNQLQGMRTLITMAGLEKSRFILSTQEKETRPVGKWPLVYAIPFFVLFFDYQSHVCLLQKIWEIQPLPPSCCTSPLKAAHPPDL